MGLGWGEVPAGDWEKLKTKPGADTVPPGDYEVTVEKYLHFPEKDANGVGVHVLVCRTTKNNEDNVGKEIHVRFKYKLNPTDDGKAKMNLISQENAKRLFEAATIEPVQTPSGSKDIVKTLESLPAKKATFIVAVKDGKDPKYGQDTVFFRPPITS